MSMTFDVFPTNRYIPKCEELKKLSQGMLSNYLLKEGVDIDILIDYKKYNLEDNNELDSNYLVTSEKEYQSFIVNNIGDALVFYRKVSDIDREFWKEEIILNDKAHQLKDRISTTLKIGYMWNIKRTMNQPAIISIYYGFLAIAIAILTDGIMYSDDGAWEYDKFPVDGKQFKEEYLDLSKLQDEAVKEFIENCLCSLKKIDY